MPAVTPVTIPLALILAVLVVLLLHVPLAVASVKFIVPPWHTTAGTGLIGKGAGLTVNVVVVEQLPIA